MLDCLVRFIIHCNYRVIFKCSSTLKVSNEPAEGLNSQIKMFKVRSREASGTKIGLPMQSSSTLEVRIFILRESGKSHSLDQEKSPYNCMD